MSTLTAPERTRTPEHALPGGDDGTRHAWVLVMTREIVARAMNKSFLASLAVSVVIVAAMCGFFAWQSTKTESFTVAVSPQDAVAVAAVQAVDATGAEQDPQVRAEVLDVADDEAALAALEDGEADAWLRPADDPADGWVLAGDGEPSTTLTAMLSAAVSDGVLARNAEAAGTSWESLSTGSTLTTQVVEGGVDSGPGSAVWVIGFVFALLFFAGAMGSGAMIASSVVEEKQSRLVEILAVAVPLRQLLAGKILGNSVIALGQNVILAAVGLVGLSFTSLTMQLPALSASVLWFVAFFAVGFVAVAAVFAVGGALASRAEDVGSTTSPIMMVLMVVYFATFMAEGQLRTVLSFVPLTNVVTMPTRVMTGQTAWWEPLVSLAVLAATAVLAVVVCERAYRGALMQTGGRVSWRRALTAEA
ncbi:ABC transporter permease [Puerhibacterium puerhi]|uniref:ABC transporter permease n=1 Tax=Puerhibacterium puerhi TaxID=2692623 RepID=UPI00135B1BEE|nr:ABC transporter permease [Puerhibacterium puerhi]